METLRQQIRTLSTRLEVLKQQASGHEPRDVAIAKDAAIEAEAELRDAAAAEAQEEAAVRTRGQISAALETSKFKSKARACAITKMQEAALWLNAELGL